MDSEQPLRWTCLRKETFDKFLDDRENILPWIAEYSPYALVNATAPPTCLFYGAPPAIGQDQKDPTHTANFGVKLQERCADLGVRCEVVYPGVSDVDYETPTDYLIATLKVGAVESM